VTIARVGDYELLRVEEEMVLDERGRIKGHWGLTIAVARDGHGLFLGSELSEPLARDLRAAFDAFPRRTDPTVPPAAFAECERLLAESGEVVQPRSGPYYVIPPGTRFRASAEITLSTEPAAARLRTRNPGNWAPGEWEELIAGRLGPWAAATMRDRVVSICHTPRVMSERAAECGVWTDPDFRGVGHAAAVTAAWAGVLHPSGRHLFYSTDADNRSSRRVAARLQLREIGWTWTLRRPAVPADDRHPLSRST
jgi:ribosomal protein S18 acetylase RimI-like enzyme